MKHSITQQLIINASAFTACKLRYLIGPFRYAYLIIYLAICILLFTYKCILFPYLESDQNVARLSIWEVCSLPTYTFVNHHVSGYWSFSRPNCLPPPPPPPPFSLSLSLGGEWGGQCHECVYTDRSVLCIWNIDWFNYLLNDRINSSDIPVV